MWSLLRAEFEGSPSTTGYPRCLARLAVVVSGCVIAAVQAACAASIPIEVYTPAGAPVAPVTTGIPFPKGLVTDPSQLNLVDASGKSVTLQRRPLLLWPDGSVRWLLADWQAAAAPARQRFELRTEAASSSNSPNIVRETEEGFVVDTGRLRFRVARAEFGLLLAAAVDGKPALFEAPSFAITVDGETRSAAAPRSVRVLENGPLRARLELRGSYGSGIDYVVRLDAYAGSAAVRLFHSIEQRSAAKSVGLERLRVEFRTRRGSEDAKLKVRAGRVGGDALVAKAAAAPWRLVQRDADTLDVAGKRIAGRGAGWLIAGNETGGAAFASRYFWQEFPQAFEAHDHAIAIDLVAAEDRPLGLGMGASKTHEFAVLFDAQRSPSESAAEAVVRMPVAVVDDAWVVVTGALRNSLANEGREAAFVRRVREAADAVARRDAKERWDDSGTVACGTAARERTGAYGMLNWGDWNFPGLRDDTKGCDAWGNQEYDLTQVYALAFAAAGDPVLHERMTAAARHFMDVDVIRHQVSEPDWVGMNHPKNPLHFSFELGGVDLGHTWNEGLWSYFVMTGDERAKESAVGIADYLERRTRTGVPSGNPRQYGWPQIALVAAYEATNDEKYKTAAEWYARRGMAAYPHADLTNWKTGILAEALAYTDSIAPSEQAREWLREYARAVQAGGTRDIRFLPALAYVARLDGSKELGDFVERRCDDIQLGSWAKPFTIGGRVGFAAMSGEQGAGSKFQGPGAR